MADLFSALPGGFSMAPALSPAAQTFWEAQEAMLSEAEAFTRHWFERRHAATQSALDTVKDITQNGASDPAAAMQAVTEWQVHSTQRLFEDVKEWAALCSRCATEVAQQEARVVGETMEKAVETAKQAAPSEQ